MNWEEFRDRFLPVYNDEGFWRERFIPVEQENDKQDTNDKKSEESEKQQSEDEHDYREIGKDSDKEEGKVDDGTSGTDSGTRGGIHITTQKDSDKSSGKTESGEKDTSGSGQGKGTESNGRGDHRGNNSPEYPDRLKVEDKGRNSGDTTTQGGAKGDRKVRGFKFQKARRERREAKASKKE